MHDNLLIYENISQCLTLSGAAQKRGRHPQEADLGLIKNAALVVDPQKNEIVWVGEMRSLPSEYENVVNRYSGEGEVWLPELVECHTHLIYAGHRHHDYALRTQGMEYLEIAKQGGGILSTIEKTRKASLDELIESAQSEIDRFQQYGVGTLEIKSGYGLTLESELKILDCIRELQESNNVRLVPTFMPAHAIPPEFGEHPSQFVEAICSEWIPEVSRQKSAEFFDVFIEKGFFDRDQAKRMMEAAKDHGFKIKVHSDQFSDMGGTDLAIEIGATSVDHLDHVSESNIRKLGESNTVAVLLPGASLFMGNPYPPARRLIDAGARVALSTDYNPGTCPSRNLPLMTTIACSQMKLTVPEAIVAITYNAAAALGLEEQLGSIAPGRQFRTCQLKAESYEVLPYCFGELD